MTAGLDEGVSSSTYLDPGNQDGAGVHIVNMEKQKIDTLSFPERNSVADLVAIASRLLTANYMNNISASGLTPAQPFVLRELMMNGPQSQSDIARALGVSRASIGETLSRLVKANLVYRERSPSDGRTLLCNLTAEGEALKSILVVSSHKQNELVSSILDKETEQTIKTILGHMVRELAVAVPTGTPPTSNWS